MANYTIQSGDTLSGIAKANNTTTDALLQANQNIIDPNKILAGSTINLPSTTNIDVNKIGTPINPLSIPQTQTNNYGSSIYQSAQNTIQDLYNQQQQISQDIINQQQQALSPLYQQQKQLQTEIAGKGAEQLQMENNVNLASQRQQLANLQSQIAQQTTKFNAEQYNFSAAGNPITASVSRKDDAIQLAMMTAAAQGMQGNIAAAETSINNAINLKYSDKEQQLQYVNDFIKTNEDKMTTAQKELANTKSTQIVAQIQQIQKDKEDMTSLITNAIKQGAPSSITSKAALASSPLEAAQVLGTYAGDYWKIKELQDKFNANNTGNYNTNNYPVGSLTKESGMTVEDYIKGIAGVESGGQETPYTAIGPVVTTGTYAGDRAYGKYQVMGKNIPEWTKQAFGKAMTMQEFLTSPEKQDALIKYRAEKDYAKYGNWDDVASVWFSGKPYNGNLSADVTGTTVPEYINRFRKNTTSANSVGITFNSLINQATNAQAANTQTKYRQDLQSMINNGDYKNALVSIESATSKNLTGDNKTKYDNARAAIRSAEKVKTLLQDYSNAGGNTGLLKGKYESILNNLGNVSDPKYKTIATDLRIALQQYRNDMSGAAFSAQEAKDYASVNPAGTNKLDLNLAILDGMINNFQRKVDSTTESQMGNDIIKLRDLANGNTTLQSSDADEFEKTNNQVSNSTSGIGLFIKSLFN